MTHLAPVRNAARQLLWGVPFVVCLSAAQATADELRGTLDFPGGTVGEYVELVKNTWAGHRGSIVVDQGVTEIAAPPISLKEVGIGTAVRVLASTQAARERSLEVKEVDDYVFVITAEVPGRLSRLVRAGMQALDPKLEELEVSLLESVASERRESRLRVFPLVRILDEPSHAEAALRAVDSALGLQQGAESVGKAVVRFHKDSGLLFFRGSGEQLEIVEQVLRAMSGEWDEEEHEDEGHDEHDEAQHQHMRRLARIEQQQREYSHVVERIEERDREIKKELERLHHERETLVRQIEKLGDAVSKLSAQLHELRQARK